MKGERTVDCRRRGEETRFKVAYLKINLGLAVKDIAQRLKMNTKTVEYHWFEARKQIKKCAL